MSDISSAGIAPKIRDYGKTCRKDVLGGVDVPVVPGAAVRGIVQCRVDRGSSASRWPHAE